MLRKKAKDLDSEYKQLQLEYQEKENRMIALENEVEVKDAVRRSVQLHSALNSCDVMDICGSYLCVLHVMWIRLLSVVSVDLFFLWFGMLILCFSLLKNPASGMCCMLGSGNSMGCLLVPCKTSNIPALTSIYAGLFQRGCFGLFCCCCFLSLFLVPCPV